MLKNLGGTLFTSSGQCGCNDEFGTAGREGSSGKLQARATMSRSLPMAAQQTARVAITAADMTAAQRDFRAVIKIVITAAMIRTIWTRRGGFVATMTAKTP